METEAKLGDSEVVPLKFQVERLTTELNTIAAHNKWLNEELQSKNDQLADVRQNHATEVANLRSERDEANEAQDEATVQVGRLQRQVQQLETQNQRLSKDLRNTQEEAITAKADSDAALQQADRLGNLQQEQLERLQQKHDSVVNQLEALKRHAIVAEEDGQRELEARQGALESKSKDILHQQSEAYEQQIAELRAKLNDMDRRRQDAEDSVMNTSVSRRISAPGGRLLAIGDGNEDSGDHDGPLNLTDLYSRLATAEDALASETLRRKKSQILLERVQAEISANAPILVRQRQEYEDAVDREVEYRKRLGDAMDEAKSAREEARDVQAEVGQLRLRNRELEEETTALAQQVQTLLMSRSAAMGQGSELPPDAEIVKMQSTNQRLLAEVRKSTATIQELQYKLQTDNTRSILEAREKELEEIRADQKRQEIMVESIVQQRDLYRALLNKQDGGILGSGAEETSALQVARKQSERSRALEESKQQLEQDLAKAQASLSTVEKDKEVAAERLARYETLNAELTSSVDRLQNEVSAAKAEVARSTAEATFHREKSSRAEETVERNRNEISRLASSKNEMQRINASLQEALSKANTDISRQESELQQTKMNLRLAEARAEAAKSAEQRIADESNQLRNEVSRQGSLIDSIQRIEASLNAKSTAEEETFKAQVTSLTEQLSNAESKYASERESLSGKIADQDIKIKELEGDRERNVKGMLDAKKELLATATNLAELKKKCAQLETQLRTAKAKLGGSSEEKDAEADLQLKVSTLTEELEASRKQVESLTERVTTFEKLSKSNEAAVSEQTQASNVLKKSYDDEVANLKNQLELTATEATKSKEVIAELTNDLAAQRSERAKALEGATARVAELQTEAEKYKKDAESTQSRFSQLESEVLVLRADVAGAQNNYERELALHASARSDLRKANEQAEAEAKLRNAAEDKAETLSRELVAEKSQLDKEKEQMATTIQDYEKNLEQTRSQNSLLHAQLEKIGDQIEKIQGGKGSEATEVSGDPSAIHKTEIELREVIKFVRSEKEMVQTQLDSARRAAERERAAAAIAKRSLDEARAELKVLQESTQGSIAGAASDIEGMKEKLIAAEQQTKLLGESNSHLRAEVKKLEASLSNAQTDLTSAKSASAPSEKRQKELEAENAGHVAEKESLLREINDWKGRVQSLVSKFNQVDPAEHAKVVKKVETLEAQVKELETKKTEAETDGKRIRALASRVSKELTQHKNLVETHKKAVAKLKTEKEALVTAQKDGASKKEVDEVTAKLKKLEQERATEKIQLTGAQGMNEKLRERLRQFQKTIVDLKKKDVAVSKELKEAKEQLEKQQTDSKKTADAPAAVAAAPTPAAAPAPAEKAAPPKAVDPPAAAEKAMSVEVAVAKKVEKVAVAKVPAGGFNFAPSPEPAKTTPAVSKAAPTKPQPSKKRPAESPEETSEAKKAKAPDAKEAANEPEKKPAAPPSEKASGETTTPSKPAMERRGSGEARESSMKEKLLEKKRKLALLQQKKKEMLEKASADQVTKKAKVDEEKSEEEAPALEMSASKESMVSEATAASVPAAEAEEGEEGEVEAKDESKVEAKDETKDEGKTSESQEKPEDTEKANPTGLSATAAPFNPFGGAKSVQPAFGSLAASSGTTVGFGQLSSSGGSSQVAQSPTGFGAQSSTGFGAKASGFGSGFGSAPAAGGSIFGAKKAEDTKGTPATASGFGSGGGGAFLNMKPPGSSTMTPQFTFGSSSSITLPTPTNPLPQTTMFNAFSSPNPNASFSAKPLFGAPPVEAKEEEKPDEKEETEEGEETN